MKENSNAIKVLSTANSTVNSRSVVHFSRVLNVFRNAYFTTDKYLSISGHLNASKFIAKLIRTIRVERKHLRNHKYALMSIGEAAPKFAVEIHQNHNRSHYSILVLWIFANESNTMELELDECGWIATAYKVQQW